jgi:hypothetical protein
MIFRARTDIKSGSELFVPYVGPATDAKNEEKRKGVLDVHFKDGQCECDFCQDDRLDGPINLSKRRELVNTRWSVLKKQYEAFGSKTKAQEMDALKVKVASFVSELEKTYRPGHGSIKPDLVMPYHVLAELHVPTRPNFHKEANPLSLKCLVADGAVFDIKKDSIKVLAVPIVPGNTVTMILNMAWRLARRDKDDTTKEAELWVSAAAQASRIIYGDDNVKQFVDRFRREIEQYDLEWMVGLLSASSLRMLPFICHILTRPSPIAMPELGL